MRSFKFTLNSFVLLFIPILIINLFSVVIYRMAADKGTAIVVLAMIGLTLVAALICTIIDYIRRKLMIDRPLQEILYATKQLAKGNFKVRLIPNHSYDSYNEFDYIKDDLNKMAGELSQSEVLKTDFVSNVSHEIKTPVSVIMNYAKALDDDTLDKETRKKYLSILQDSCKSLSTLVTNILKLNKLENQKLNIEIERFNLSESLSSCILRFEDIIERKDILLECDIEEDLYINSNESYLELVWNNLISNALKFTEKDGTVKVYLKKIDDEYVVKVSDTGCGIDEETGKHMFDKFYQGDTSHQKEGNGLGLPLVKKVIDVLGGTIGIESEVGVGTTFTIIIKEG